jgi:hypothetical protein
MTIGVIRLLSLPHIGKTWFLRTLFFAAFIDPPTHLN